MVPSRSPVTAFLAPFRHLGLFLTLGVATLLLGATVHHFSSLPSAYSWWAALTTLRAVIALPHIPAIALVVYGIGRYAHRGNWDPRTLGRRLTSQVSLGPEGRRAIALSFATACLAAAADAVIFPTHAPTDILAVFIFGAQLPKAFRKPRLIVDFIAQGVIAAFVFSVLCYTFTVIKALLFQGSDPLDAHLVDLETFVFGEPIHRMIGRFAASDPDIVWWSDWVYNRFFHHMILTTVLLFALRKPREQNEYLAALLFCYLAGGPLYHLWPAVGPMFFEPEYFEHVSSQPGLVTNFLQHWLFRQTGLVNQGEAKELLTWTYLAAMPSLHVAHEVVMTWYSRRSRIAFTLSLTFTIATLFAIMVLGWHYFVDALAGATLAIVSIAIARKLPNAFMPSFVAVQDDVALPRPRPILRPFLEGLREGAAEKKRIPVTAE